MLDIKPEVINIVKQRYTIVDVIDLSNSDCNPGSLGCLSALKKHWFQDIRMSVERKL